MNSRSFALNKSQPTLVFEYRKNCKTIFIGKSKWLRRKSHPTARNAVWVGVRCQCERKKTNCIVQPPRPEEPSCQTIDGRRDDCIECQKKRAHFTYSYHHFYKHITQTISIVCCVFRFVAGLPPSTTVSRSSPLIHPLLFAFRHSCLVFFFHSLLVGRCVLFFLCAVCLRRRGAIRSATTHSNMF